MDVGRRPMRPMQFRSPERLAARAMLLLHAVLLVGIAGAAEEVAPPAAEVASPCADSASGAVAVFSSPRAPQPGGILRAIAVSERRLTATLVVLDPDGQPAGATTERRGG